MTHGNCTPDRDASARGGAAGAGAGAGSAAGAACVALFLIIFSALRFLHWQTNASMAVNVPTESLACCESECKVYEHMVACATQRRDTVLESGGKKTGDGRRQKAKGRSEKGKEKGRMDKRERQEEEFVCVWWCVWWWCVVVVVRVVCGV